MAAMTSSAYIQYEAFGRWHGLKPDKKGIWGNG